MKRAKGKAVKRKPVRMWTLSCNGDIWPAWLHERKSDVVDELAAHGGIEPGEKIIRVEIRPVAPKRKPRKKA